MKKLLLTVALAACMPVSFGQSALSVNGQTISTQNQKDLIALLQEQGMTDEKQRLTAARNILVERAVVAQEVRKLKLDQTTAVREKLDGQRHAIYLEALAQNHLKDRKPTQKELDEQYKELQKEYDPTFVQISQITVKTEPEAKDLITQVNKGGDFAALAKEKSLEPQAKQTGGQLPMINIRNLQAVPGLNQAVASVEEGKVIQAPFRTKEGFVIVKVDKKEQRPLPESKEIEKQLTELWARNEFKNYVLNLAKNAKITEGAPATAPTGKK